MELFGINGSEFLVLAVVVILVSGPKGVVQLWKLFNKGLAMFRAWSARLRQDTDLGALAADLRVGPGPLDLRKYDPRALVREAVREEMDAWARQTAAPAPSPPVSPMSQEETRD